MKTFSFYDEKTGIFSGKKLSGPDKYLEKNTPPGCKAIEGSFDHLSQRVDLGTGLVVDYRPPQPDADHEWNVQRRRWRLKPAVRAARRKREAAIARIEELERQQHRRVRELLFESDPRLQEIDAEIQALRSDL